jgi:hypothetical protein
MRRIVFGSLIVWPIATVLTELLVGTFAAVLAGIGVGVGL